MADRGGKPSFWARFGARFAPGGPWKKYLPIFEMVDSFIFWTNAVTQRAPHVRDALDIKRVMSYVVVATLPCVLMSWYNTGYQAHLALALGGEAWSGGWRSTLLATFGLPADPESLSSCFLYGFLCFLPIYVVTVLVGGLWEVIFATVRGHEVNEGFLVTSILYTLTLPPDIPLWLVALGISFGVVIGKEIFGGSGMNFLNPALTGRAFLYFAYPASMSGDAVWVAVDGYSGATPLGLAAEAGIPGVLTAGYSWWQAFLGIIPGSLGETSALACLLGGAFLVWMRIASWRIILGVFFGMVATAVMFELIGSSTNPMFAMPWYWHLVTGGFAFGMVYMATDPVSAAATKGGRWVFGFLIGFMVVMIRVVNPAFPEGMMLAIIFANMFAPAIDYVVTKMNIRKRMRRYAGG